MEKKFRPCTVKDKRGVFHGWFQYDGVRMNGHGRIIDGNIKFLSGLVEFEDGSIQRVEPENIKFEDNADFFKQVEQASSEWFDNSELKMVEKKAVWIYWDGWKSNHDRRIEDAVCSQCGY